MIAKSFGFFVIFVFQLINSRRSFIWSFALLYLFKIHYANLKL